jgi:hypothetical protein
VLTEGARKIYHGHRVGQGWSSGIRGKCLLLVRIYGNLSTELVGNCATNHITVQVVHLFRIMSVRLSMVKHQRHCLRIDYVILESIEGDYESSGLSVHLQPLSEFHFIKVIMSVIHNDVKFSVRLRPVLFYLSGGNKQKQISITNGKREQLSTPNMKEVSCEIRDISE